MPLFDLVCGDCGHKFQVTTRGPIKVKQKVCPACGSRRIRQTFTSFLRNGSLATAGCAAQRSSGFG